MYKEINAFPDSYRGHAGRWKMCQPEAGFKCRYCQAHVHTLPILSGVQNRNHCPFCLWSRHVDQNRPGDRMSACKAIMQPIGLTVKQSRNKYGSGTNGELMLIHLCSECGKLSINRIAADDLLESLMEIFHASSRLDTHTQHQLDTSGIRLLQGEDVKLFISQLHGITKGLITETR
ncbi:MAG: RNHCP domain-containing protein [Anaerolineales bacterium]